MVNRPFLPRLGLLLALTFTLAGTTAWAQKELVALHPCVITGGKPKAPTTELEAACALEVVRTNVELVPSTAVRDYLEKEARGSCARAKNRNACLGRLAASTRANRTLYLTVAPYSPVTRITGLVVDTSGKVVEQKSLELARVRNQPPRDTVRIAVLQLLSQLALTSAPPSSTSELAPSLEAAPTLPQLEPPAVAQAPEPAPPAPPQPLAPMASEPAPGRSWKTPVGLTGVGLGVVGLGLATVFTLQAQDSDDKLGAYYSDGAAPLLTDDNVRDIRQLRDDADSKRTLGIISGAAGVVLGGVGAYLWLSDGPSDEPRKAGSARLSAGPGNVGLLVVLP